jgi:hypothetical protein
VIKNIVQVVGGIAEAVKDIVVVVTYVDEAVGNAIEVVKGKVKSKM